MSTPTQTTDAGSARGRFTATSPNARTRRRIALIVAFVVLAWSTLELIGLVSRHTTGPELYGVLVAVLAVGASILSLLLLAADRRRPTASAAVIALWAVIALGGVAGSVAHIVGPGEGHGVVDPRPRPPEAPLVFTTLGLVGGAAVFYGRARTARIPKA